MLISIIKKRKQFTIKELEIALGYDRTISYSTNKITEASAERISNQAYYYLAKFLKEKLIKKTNRYEQQDGTKGLMIYEIVK